MGFGESISKILLIIFNVCFFIIGSAIFSIGIWLKVNKSNFAEVLKKIKLGDHSNSIENASSSVFNVVAILLIILGLFTFVTGFCGCCGAFKESKCLLYTYAFLVGSVIITQVAIGVYVGVKKNKVKAQIQKSLIKLLHKDFNGALSKKPSAYTVAFTQVMFEFKCCGIKGESDFEEIKKNWRQLFVSGIKQIHPIGCCKLKNSFDLKNKYNEDEYKGLLQNPNCPFEKDAKINKIGCFESLIKKIEKHMKVIIGVCIGLGLFEILCIVFACCVAKKDE